MKRLTIIDGNSLLFRAYYASAYPGTTLMRTKDGIPTNALYIFANMLVRILDDIAPDDGLLVAFDTGAKTFRHQQLETYKAQRKKAPEELVAQMPIARELLAALGVFTFEMNGYEGDDVAGSAAMLAHDHGHEVHLYTSDRDFLQLVNTTIKVHLIKRGMSDIRIMNRDRVIEEYGLTPEQIPDYKGLCGDASDNLPGIPGIGDKTATKLLAEYQTFENILAHASDIGGKIASNLIEHQSIGALSKELAIIDTKMKLPFSLADTVYHGYDFETITAFGARYELKTFLTKLPPSWRLHQDPVALEVRQVTSLTGFKHRGAIGLYFDATDGNYHKNAVHGLALSGSETTVYLSLESAQKDPLLRKMLLDDTITKYVYDLKATYVYCHRFDLSISGPFIDVLLAAYTLDTSSNTAPEAILSLYGANFCLEDETTLFETGKPNYAGQVAYFMPRLWNKIEAELHIKDSLAILYDLEMPLALVLAKMELEGFPIDGNLLSQIGATFRQKLDQVTKRIYEMAGHEFNIASPKQVGVVLFDELGLPKNRKGSTGADVLKSLAERHPLPALLLEHRKYAKLLSTYIDTLINQIYPDGKLHAVFNQALTSTGRLSSTDPNLQNIALRDEEGRLVRQAFYYPDEKYVLMSFDYSQIELRILAHLSHCPALIEVFNRDQDIHTATAKRLFAHDGEITSLMRRKAKAVNFGIIYGISDWGLSEQLEIPPEESRKIITAFYAAYPEVKQYMIDLVDQVQANGYVTTLIGRRRYLREIHDSNYQTREFAKRAAMNAPIQGTAADLIKLAMINIDSELAKRHLSSRLVLQIHDELVFKVPLEEIDILKPLVLDTMEKALPLDVKLQVVATQGRTWYDLKD